MKIGACYIRVSTDDQAELSPETQLLEIQKYAKAHDIIINNEFVFIDEGISGRKSKNRPGFQELIGKAKQKPKPFDMILVWKFARFARNQEESVFYKSLLRKQLGIDVVSISEPIEDNPFGSLIERIIEWFDEYYSIRLGEEVKRSMTEKARRGDWQTSAPYGYTKVPGKVMQIYEPEAQYVRRMFHDFALGKTYFAIARELNADGARSKSGNKIESRTVEYIINNPAYIGYARWTPTGQTVGKRIYDSSDTIIVKSDHEPIISQELWDTCRESVKRRKATRKKHERPAETKKHWIIGLLKCGTCGKSLTYSAANNGFQCIDYAKGKHPVSHFINLNKIESLVYDALEELGNNTEYLENINLVTDKEPELDSIQREIARAEAMLQRAKQAYIEGYDTIEEYGENKNKIEQSINALEKKKSTLTKASKPDIPQMQKKIHSIVDLLKDPDVEHLIKYNAIRDICELITFKRPEEEVNIYLYHRI